MMHELQPGDPQLIGPYRLRGRLGAGGMGRVYLGLSPGGRPVAVKVIRGDLAQDPEFLARFRREITVARKVSGLFTAPVIDADLDGPVPWLATAYVPGPSLADAVSQHGPLPAGSVLALAKGLAEGLKAIHAAGVVHRDLKPANVLLAEDGPRVIDFGISRAVESSALTHTGLVVGSPGFMSPEQAEGRLVGPPSDIFSLGAVLAFAATGQGPFGAGSTPALVYRVVHSLPNLEYLPGEVRPLVERCLAKDPAQRPTAAQVLAGGAYPATGWLPAPVTRTFSLDTAQVGAPLTAAAARLAPPPAPLASPPGSGRARRRAGRHPWRSGWRSLTAAAILAGLVGAGVTVGVTMTAGSPPAHAAQSVQRDAGSIPVLTHPPTYAPASVASSSPTTAAPTRSVPAYTQAPSTPLPATMTPPPATSAPPRPSTSPSPSMSSPHSTPAAPAPTTSAPTTPAGY
jgi:serine/threonine protein kinase